MSEKFHFTQLGQGEPLVFLNASGLGPYYWGSQITPFSQKYQSFVIDCKGFGHSIPFGKKERKFAKNLEEHAHYVNKFLDKLDFDEVTLIGHSFGSLIALWTSFENPGRISNLVLVEPDSLFMDSGEKRLLQRTLSMTSENFEKNISSFVEKTAGTYLKGELLDSVLKDTQKNSVCYRNIFEILSQLTISRDQLEEKISEIPSRVILIYGGRNQGDEAARRLEANGFDLFQRSRFEILLPCGHNPMMENPQLFNRVFVKTLEEKSGYFLLNRWNGPQS